MAYLINDDKINQLLNVSEKHNTYAFNFGVVVNKIGMTGHNIKEFVPVLTITKQELLQRYIPEEEFKDTKTIDMWEEFK